MDTTTLTQHPPSRPPIDPTLIAHGAQCTWWGAAADADYDGQRLRCPSCYGPLDVKDSDGWEQLVQSGADQYADLVVDVGSYEQLIAWTRGHCYQSIDDATAGYRAWRRDLAELHAHALPADAPGAWIRDAIEHSIAAGSVPEEQARAADADLARFMPDPAAQERAAQRIVDALPDRRLTIGEGLSILAVALEAIGVLEAGS